MSTTYEFTTAEKENILIDFVNGGGHIIFMHQPENNHNDVKIGELLMCFGIAMPECSFEIGNANNKKIEITRRFKETTKITFTSTVSRYINYIQNGNVTVDGLDTFITILRFYLDPLNTTLFYAIKPLFDVTMKFFIESGYNSATKLSKNSELLIALVFLTDVYFMFTPEDTGPAIDYQDFPGPFPKSIPKIKITRKVHLKPNILISAGLYLSPHETGSLEVEGDVEGIIIQIGSHPNISFSMSEYRRLPVVTCRVDLSQQNTTLTNPFGGLIYIMSNAEKIVKFNFSGVVESSTFDINDPSIWNRTANSVAPWGEIVSSDFLISVPTTVMRGIDDLDASTTIIQSIVKSVRKIIVNISETSDQVRFVYDRVTAEMSHICDSAVILDVSTASEFLSNVGPTKLTLDFIWKTALAFITEIHLDEFGSSLVSDIIAGEVFSEYWPECHFYDFPEFQEHQSFKAFEVLWRARAEFGENILRNALQNLQQLESHAPEEDLVQLIHAFSMEAKVNLFPALIKLRPLPFAYYSKNVSLNGFPEFH